MGKFANILCKTVGLAGMGAVLYDAYTLGSIKSKRGAVRQSVGSYMDIVAAQRTASSDSYVSSAIQNKTAELRMNNKLIPFWGRVKGFVNGTLDSLGNNIVPVIFSSLALLTKGFMSKVGAWGLAGCGVYVVLKEGFGIGKHSPIDKNSI